MTIRQLLESTIAKAIQKTFQLDTKADITKATRAEFGDYQANFAMKLAKKLHKKPRDIAAQALESLSNSQQFNLSIAGPGFLNIKLHDSLILNELEKLHHDDRMGVPIARHKKRIVVDYSNPNIAKEMHVGHLRSAVIGDSICRILSYLGHNVIRQNHIGDWGTQFGQLLEYQIELKANNQPTEIHHFNAFYQAAQKRFQSDESFAKKARERVVLLQKKDPETIQLWQQLVDQSHRYFNKIYPKLDLLLTPEDIRAESFYNPMLPSIVETLLSSNIACHDQGATVVKLEAFKTKSGEDMGMIIQKSDGGYLYATTDLAALKYRVEQLNADEIIYVTDHRQKLHFEMLFATARQAQWITPDYPVKHVSFGAVLGQDKKPLKTRSGDLITLQALLDEAEKKASQLLSNKSNHTDAQVDIANIIGIGSLKFADLSSDKQKDYVFDWNQMLSFEGKTAPYLLNAYVRIQSVLRHSQLEHAPKLMDTFTSQYERQLAIKCLQFPDSILDCIDGFEIQQICQYIYELAQCYHQFYEHCPILKADNATIIEHRIALCQLTAKTLKKGLYLVGIRTIDYM